MKNYLVLLAVLLLFSGVASAQTPVRIQLDNNGTQVDNSLNSMPVIEGPLKVASTTMVDFGPVVTTVPIITGAKEITIVLTTSGQKAWIKLGGDDPAVGVGIPVSSSIEIKNLNPNEIIKAIASTTTPVAIIQR